MEAAQQQTTTPPPPEWDDYHARWERVWAGNLRPGQVRCTGIEVPSGSSRWKTIRSAIASLLQHRLLSTAGSLSLRPYLRPYLPLPAAPWLQHFDKGRPSRQLTVLLDSGSLAVEGKRAFVPGCG
jgi:hypothetical protein